MRVEVFKAVRAPVTVGFVRGVLEAAGGVPAVAAAVSAGATVSGSAATVSGSAATVGPSVSVRITGDRELRRLNKAFLGLDEVTDVLSFPSGSEGPADDGYLGDLAVSWPAVVRQASSFGYPASGELALLLVHGLLHLLGWDHASAAEEAAMTAVTVEALGLAGVVLPQGRLRA